VTPASEAAYREEADAQQRRWLMAPRAKALADDLIAAAGDLKTQGEREMFWQGDHLASQADRGREIGEDLEQEIRAKYRLEEKR
jgi:hypothetical protein